MKKFYLILLSFSIITISKASTFDLKPVPKTNKMLLAEGNGCFDKSSHVINLGIGFGGGRYYKSAKSGSGYSYRITPVFTLSYEQAWKPKLGPGYLGVGALLGYQTARYRFESYSYYYNTYPYNNGYYYYQHHWNYIHVAARAAYHWDVLNSEKAEVYGGVLIGMRIQTYSYTTNDPSPYRNTYELKENNIYPTFSIFAGARWYFVPKFALFAEAGYGISYVNVGLSFKF